MAGKKYDPFRGDKDLEKWVKGQLKAAVDAGVDHSVVTLAYKPVNGSECETIQGEVLKPIFGRIEGGEEVRTDNPRHGVIGADFVPSMIEVPKRAEHFKYMRRLEERGGNYLRRGLLRAVRFSQDDYPDPQSWLSTYHYALDKKAKVGKVLVGNLKSRESVLYYATPRILRLVFGYDFLADKNPFKVIDLFRTTSKMEFRSSTRDTVKIRILDKMTLEDVLGNVGIKDIPVNDGCCFAKWNLRIEQLPKRGKKAGPPRALHSCAQVRINIPAMKLEVKANTYASLYHYFMLHAVSGFNPYEADLIMTLDNVKNKDSKWKHGDIIEIPAETVRLIGIASRRGKSSYGVQLNCMGAEVHKFRDILIEKGLPEKAMQVRRAIEGRLSAVVDIIFGQSRSGKFEDNRELYAKALFAFLLRDEHGEEDWFISRHQSNVSTLKLRVNRMIGDELLKYKVSDLGVYIMPNDDLDVLEHELYKQLKAEGAENAIFRYYVPCDHVRVRRYIHGAKAKKDEQGNVKPPVLPFKNCLVGGNPVVWPGSIMHMLPLRKKALEAVREFRRTGVWSGYNPLTDTSPIIYNQSHDCYEISNASAYMAFRDFDGDMATVCYTNVEAPRNYATVMRVEPPEAPFTPPTRFWDMIYHLKEVSRMIAQAALDTGLVDLECRRIYIRRLVTKRWLTPKEAFLMGCLREAKISGIKHLDAGAEDAVHELRRKYDIFDPRVSTRPPEYAIVHRNAGISRDDNPNPTDANVLDERLSVLNKPNYQWDEELPQWAGLKYLVGSRVQLRHNDSGLIKKAMFTAWDHGPKPSQYRLRTDKKGHARYLKDCEIFQQSKGKLGMVQLWWAMYCQGVHYPFIIAPGDFGATDQRPSIIADALMLSKEYDGRSASYIHQFEQDGNARLKAESFRQLARDIKGWDEDVKDEYGAVVKTIHNPGWLDGVRQDMGEFAEKYESYLAIYVAYLGFGSGVSREGKAWSRPGSVLWMLSDAAIVYAAWRFNPDNPELHKARKRLAQLGKEDKDVNPSIPDEEDSVSEVE